MKQVIKTTSSLFIIFIALLSVYGWGKNIYLLIDSNFEKPYKNEIIRAAGLVFPPIGAMAGFIDIKD